MYKFLALMMVFLNVAIGYGVSNPLTITRVETDDLKNISVLFQDNPPIYAYLNETKELFYPNEDNRLVLPINNGQTVSSTNFEIFESYTDTYLGEIEFRYTPNHYHKHREAFVTLFKHSFIFPKTKDIIKPRYRPRISKTDYKELLTKVSSWNANALQTIQSPQKDLMERCSLIIQYVWSHNPICSFSPSNFTKLSLIQMLEGLENNEISLLCGNHSTLFVILATILMPDLKIRQTSCYECNVPVFYRNMHVLSHAFVEVFHEGHWVYLDPYLRLYFTDKSERLVGALELRELIRNQKFDTVTTHHIPTIIPTDPDIYNNFRIPYCFNLLQIREVKSR